MRHKKVKLSVVLLLGLGLTALQAQEALTTSGGNASGTGGTASYSIGQVVYTTNIGTNGTVAQGVQQPYEISVVTAIRNTEDINLKCLVYPNPTGGITKLVFESPDFENVRFRLFDINGALLQDKKVESNETEIYVGNLSSSVYFLKVYNNNIEIKVFKIVKK
jgi:hypothetical protein